MLLFLMIIVAIVLFNLFLPQIKGWSGEKAVSALLCCKSVDEKHVWEKVFISKSHEMCAKRVEKVSLYSVII